MRLTTAPPRDGSTGCIPQPGFQGSCSTVSQNSSTPFSRAFTGAPGIVDGIYQVLTSSVFLMTIQSRETC
eukprot:14726440-Ditylum_brightwellii.AAC.1